MNGDAKHDRDPQDLPGPETMQIAALLAELMPHNSLGANAGSSPLSVLADQLPGPSASEVIELDAVSRPQLIPELPPPLPEVRVPAPPTVVVTPTMTPNRPRRITASVVAASAQVITPTRQELKVEKRLEPPVSLKPEPRVEKRIDPPLISPKPEPKVEKRIDPAPVSPKPEPRVEKKIDLPKPKIEARVQPLKPPTEPKPEPAFEAPKSPPVAAPITVPASEIINLRSKKVEPAAAKPAAPEAVKAITAETAKALPIAVPADDLIPLGDLSLSGYFSLVNWRNDNEQAKHPRRSDYGLDEQSLALARRNPFYVIGKPRRPETRNVASVLSEIAWE